MSGEVSQYSLRDSVAVLTMDDGKANALSPAMIASLQSSLDKAEREAGAVLLIGREARLSAGFDLSVMTKSLEDMQKLVLSGAELLMRLYLFPRPVVVACTGHALAAGALLLLAADRRIGAQGTFKIGLNEVSIQMPLPIFAVELARDRLSRRHFTAAVSQARIYDPESACDAGYLDQTAPAAELYDVAFAEARRLAGLANPAFIATKERERGASVRYMRETLAADIGALTGPKV